MKRPLIALAILLVLLTMIHTALMANNQLTDAPDRGWAMISSSDCEIHELYWEDYDQTEMWLTIPPQLEQGLTGPNPTMLYFRVVYNRHHLKATPKTVLNLTEPNRSFTLNCSDNSTCDGVVAQLPWATFLEISNASTVEGDALGFPFRLSGQQIKALKEFAQRLASGEAP